MGHNLTTEIGSVPFDGGIREVADKRERRALEDEVRQAIASGSKHPIIDKAVEQALYDSFRLSVPFLPELYRLGESLLNYIKKPFKPLCLDAFKERAKGREIAKVQMPGPQTVFFERRRAEPAADDKTIRNTENNVVMDTMAYGSALLEGLYVDVEQVILFFDEPNLRNVSNEYEKWVPVFEHFSKLYPKLLIGVHSCNNTDWGMLFSLPYVSIISCDWSQFGQVIAASDVYKNGRNGKRVARGVSDLGDVWDHRAGDLITPPCGLATKSVAECYRTLDMLLTAEKTSFA